MKKSIRTTILCFVILPLVVIACSNSQGNDNPASMQPSAEQTTAEEEPTYTGVISGLYWDNGFGEGGIYFYNPPQDLVLKLRVKDGELTLNPEAMDIAEFNGTERVLNEKYINKKVKITYKAKGYNTLNPKEHQITKIEILGEEVPNMPGKTVTGNITGVTTNDSTCVVIQAGMDEPVVDSYRIWTQDNQQKVDISSCKDIFTHKSYSTQLNPKYASARVILTLEPRLLSQRSIYNQQNRVEKYYRYCVTRIELGK